MNNVVAEGLGKSDPIASNSTAQGRKLNRRVEMVLSGDVIGGQITPRAVDNRPEQRTESSAHNSAAMN